MFSELKNTVELAMNANTIVKSMISVHHEPELLADQVQQVRILEKQADEKTFQLREDILNGAITPKRNIAGWITVPLLNFVIALVI